MQQLLADPATSSRSLVLHRIFEAQAEARADAIAVISGGQSITYGDLDARANRIARYLRRRGVRRGASVAMILPRSIDAYASLLGILKAGAAYIPIDPEYPADRIAWMLEDSGAAAVLGTAEIAETRSESTAPLPHDDDAPRAEDLCYVIYTSGSAGRPKGVMVEHRSVSHLVRAEASLFVVTPADRVYQGASLSFDLSLEEIWLAFQAGATLISATPEMAQSGPDLSRRLSELGVTVLSCVPTLLSMLNGDIPSLRLLILGGEICSRQLVERWSRPGLRIVNTYGPTETTIIATYANLVPGMPVTIGRPVPGYEVHIVDDDFRPVARGETGEICIGGPGVARGYIGLPEETRARFIVGMYRTGDLGRVDSDGNIEFIGRDDSQIKLHGRRIELGEIESALLRVKDVRAAACALRENDRGVPQLIGYVVPANSKPVNRDWVLSQLRQWLPEWMVPSLIETIGELPRLPSGKLDRASLPAPEPRQKVQRRAATGTERRLLQSWNALFHPLDVSLDDDFFLDLGGHSLLAAHMVSELRKDSRFAALTVRDLYNHPTVSRLASAMDSSGHSPEQTAECPRSPRQPPETADPHAALRHFFAGAIQAASLYFVFAFRGVQWVLPYLVYFICAAHHTAAESIAWALIGAMALLPALLLIAICAKWIVIGRVRSGRYRLWGWFYLRWWFVRTLIDSLPLESLGGTPLLPFVYRLFGARIGKNVHIATHLVAAFDVISIGDGSSVDESASLLGYTVEKGALVIGPISIGCNCFLGTNSVVSPDTVIEDGARLEDLSLLMSGARIPAGETWAGSPPQRVQSAAKRDCPPMCGRSRRSALTVLYVAIALLLPLIELFAFLPGIALLKHFSPARISFYLAAPLIGASFILCLTALIVSLKWLLMGRARAGKYPVQSWYYARHWVVEKLLALSVDVAGPLHATLFLKPWYRALGARLGRFSEVSTASITTPDLLEIGEDCFVADEVALSAARVENGWLTLTPTRLGRRVFVGNNAVIPPGTELPDESLIGVLTLAPPEASQSARKGASWLGSPPIFLPRRQNAAAFPPESTFRPSRKIQWARGCFELLRVTLPGAAFTIITVGVLEAALKLWTRWGPAATLASLPAIFAACCITAMGAVVAAKWIVMGRYKAFERPFWSPFVWWWELVNALYEFLAAPVGAEALRGTPLMGWYLRLLGAKIGRRVYIDTMGFIEFDLVEIGDRSILNRDCILQTHLFEDRVLKASRLRIGADCEIGTQSIVLYDTQVGDRARLGALSLLMKGEVLPAADRIWTGSPLEGPANLTLTPQAPARCA